MEGTHVRFARDLAAYLKVVDFDAYYSGAVYPDSRYPSGIPRDLTHGADCPHDPFAPGLTDFEKGWGTHLVYDALASVEKETALAMIGDDVREDGWSFHTAIKLVEDRQSLESFREDRSPLLRLRVVERPHGEDEAILKKYYDDLQMAYAGAWTFEEYEQTLLAWKIPADRVDRMIELARRFEVDPDIFSAVQKIYPIVLQRYVLRTVHDANR